MPRARFDDLRAGRAWIFGAPDRVLAAHSPGEVREVLRAVDAAAAAGAWAWGYVGYEAAPAFDPAMRVRPAAVGDPPLAWFAVGGPPAHGPAIDRSAAGGHVPMAPWRWDVDAPTFGDRVERIRRAIAAGCAYQVNLTARLACPGVGDPLALYAHLAHAQRGSYNAYLDLGDRAVVSASPELFFRWDASGITTRPMKGTAPRGRDAAADDVIRAELLGSAKQRAENVMIVDVLRNDLSRVARAGSVRVRSLLDAERYVTVWQLTSTVTAEPRPETGLPEVFEALFPCGSVTGAPKGSAMELIADLETSTRGVYCGAVGMVAPPGAEFRARFSVPIRTATIDRAAGTASGTRTAGTATYGVGGGITWGSDPADEYREMVHKAAILDRPAVGGFELLETVRLTSDGAFRHLERHLARLAGAARYFDIPLDAKALRACLDDVARSAVDRGPRDHACRARILVTADGRPRVEVTPLDDQRVGSSRASPRAVGLAMDTEPTPASCWTVHKTTYRDHYRAAADRHPHADDVILVNESGAVTETTRATLAVRIDGRWYTPPLSSGCLPGIERQHRIGTGLLAERELAPSDLAADRALAVLSSLRGWRPARLLPPADRPA